MKKPKARNRVAKTRKPLWFDIVANDSMEPTIKRGDHVSIDIRFRAIDEDGIYLITWARRPSIVDAQLVRAIKIDDGVLWRWDNWSYVNERLDYKSCGGQYLSKAESARVAVIGRAVLIKRTL